MAEDNYLFYTKIVKIGPGVDLKSVPALCAKPQHGSVTYQAVTATVSRHFSACSA